MNGVLTIRRAGPSLTLQDMGRNGYRASGLSKGGALDISALQEGAAILGRTDAPNAIEMIGYGGEFEVSTPAVFVVTGARMKISIDGTTLESGVSHMLHPGKILKISAAVSGQVGYLHLEGGFKAPEILGSVSANLAGGIGERLQAGVKLSYVVNPNCETNKTLPKPRDATEVIGVLPSAQTALFDEATLQRFLETSFRLDAHRLARQGTPLLYDGEGFATHNQTKIVSDAIFPGDIQVVGTGTPYVLLAESQTIGGYPRIATVLPSELSKLVQSDAEKAFRFRFMSYEDAEVSMNNWERSLARLLSEVRNQIRDPKDIADLLAYNLVSGVVSGAEED